MNYLKSVNWKLFFNDLSFSGNKDSWENANKINIYLFQFHANHYPLAIDCSIKKFNQIISEGYIVTSMSNGNNFFFFCVNNESSEVCFDVYDFRDSFVSVTKQLESDKFFWWQRQLVISNYSLARNIINNACG